MQIRFFLFFFYQRERANDLPSMNHRSFQKPSTFSGRSLYESRDAESFGNYVYRALSCDCYNVKTARDTCS